MSSLLVLHCQYTVEALWVLPLGISCLFPFFIFIILISFFYRRVLWIICKPWMMLAKNIFYGLFSCSAVLSSCIQNHYKMIAFRIHSLLSKFGDFYPFKNLFFPFLAHPSWHVDEINSLPNLSPWEGGDREAKAPENLDLQSEFLPQRLLPVNPAMHRSSKRHQRPQAVRLQCNAIQIFTTEAECKEQPELGHTTNLLHLISFISSSTCITSALWYQTPQSQILWACLDA